MKKLMITVSILITLIYVSLWGGMRWISTHPEIVIKYGFEHQDTILDRLDLTDEERETAENLLLIGSDIFTTDGVERHYLVLLQNHMELRPGGGFLGQVITLSIKDSVVTQWEVRDANHLDREIKSDILAPGPIAKWLGIKKLNFRDANWELDFPTNVENITYLFDLSDEPRKFDGVIALNASILEDVLALTGPVTVLGHEEWGEFTQEGGLLKLQDAVEKPFLLYEQRQACEKEERVTGIEKVCSIDPKTGEKIKKITHADRDGRKKILTNFAVVLRDAVMQPLREGSWLERIDGAQDTAKGIVHIVQGALAQREMQIWMRDAIQESAVREQNWSLTVDTQWEGDYLAIADANLGALKTDYHINRALEYTIDFTGSRLEINDAAAGRMIRYVTPDIRSQAFAQTHASARPLATMRMTYDHTAEEESYRTSDYHAYTRLYVPRDSDWLVREWFFEPDVEERVYSNKMSFGYKYDIFIGDKLPTMLQYLLPGKITQENYSLKIQKQSGIENLPVKVRLITASGDQIKKEFILRRDVVVRFDVSTKEITVEHQ